MSMSESFRALRRANPRVKPGFGESVDSTAVAVRAQIAHMPVAPAKRRDRRRLVPLAVVGGLLAAAAAAAVLLTVDSAGVSPGVENAAAAVRKAARLTAASAERSGTAVVRMTHGGTPWAGKTVRWNGVDVEIVGETPGTLLVVDGTMYASEGGGWVQLGSPDNIDPDSGTTPAEYLAAVREDIGDVTLRRITGGMTGLTTSRLADGSTVYDGMVAAGLIARETGFKEGQSIRVLPFGYVAHDEAADAATPLATAVTVGADNIVRQIAVRWGSGASAWTYTVTYSDLGSTAAPVAPANARPLRVR
jgi:hypothetical protein